MSPIPRSLYHTGVRAYYKILPPIIEEMIKCVREQFEDVWHLRSTGSTESERLGKQFNGMG